MDENNEVLSREIKTVKENLMEILGDIIIISEIKNSLDGLNNRMETRQEKLSES